MAENADALTLGNVEAEPVKYVLPNSKDFTSPLTDMSVITFLLNYFATAAWSTVLITLPAAPRPLPPFSTRQTNA